MKKSLFIGSILLTSISMQSLMAQNTSPYWSLAGNNNATAASKLGTTNAIPLRFLTNNVERMSIDATGKVGIGITTPVAILTVKSSGGTPVSSWLNVGSTPVLAGFSENKNGELNIGTASLLPDNRAVFQGKRSRGTLAAPTAVVSDDYLLSFVSSGYDGTAFQNPATISFYVDGTPTPGNVPGRISFVTGSNTGNRQERLKVGSTGNFDFNNGQVFIQQASGNVGIGTTTPGFALDAQKNFVFGRFKSTAGYAGVIIDKSSSGTNGYVIHQTAGVDRWTEGTIGNDNFSLRNWSIGIDALTANFTNNNVGIGTSTPGYRLDVAGRMRMRSGGGTAGTWLMNAANTSDVSFIGMATDNQVGFYGNTGAGWGFAMNTTNGNVGIGTLSSVYRLSVNGTIRAKEVRVESGWADYVFEKDYKLKSLESVAKYIEENKHLPGVASAKEIQENGLAVGEMQSKMMEKIEENTLYIIELNNKIKHLEKIIDELTKKSK